MKHKHLPRHVIGGIALTNGLLLHAPDVAVLAVRGLDGAIETEHFSIPKSKPSSPILQLPFIRGLWLLWRTVEWHGRVRVFADVAIKRMIAENPAFKQDVKQSARVNGVPASLFPSLGLVAAILLYGLVVLLVQTVIELQLGQFDMAQSNALAFFLILLFLIWLVRRSGIWEYMGYHGAQHQAIHAFEEGKRTYAAVQQEWPWQARCGAGVVSYVAIFLIIIGFLLPSINGWLILPLAITLFSVAYEIILVTDQHSDALWARIIAMPGVMLQYLVARDPSADQSAVATKALFELTHYSVELKKHQDTISELVLT